MTRCNYASICPRNVARSQPMPLTQVDLEGLFKRHDTNGDGKLDKEELKKAFKEIGARFSGWRAVRAIAFGDRNKDGLINFEDELEKVVKYALKKGYTIN